MLGVFAFAAVASNEEVEKKEGEPIEKQEPSKDQEKQAEKEKAPEAAENAMQTPKEGDKESSKSTEEQKAAPSTPAKKVHKEKPGKGLAEQLNADAVSTAEISSEASKEEKQEKQEEEAKEEGAVAQEKPADEVSPSSKEEVPAEEASK